VPHDPTRPNAVLPTIGLAAIGLFSPGLSDAQPVAVPEVNVTGERGASYQGDIVTRPGPRSAIPLAEVAQSVTSVPRELMEQRVATTVRDALRNVTGISLAAGEGGFSGDNLTLRGFSARGDFYIDGIRDSGQYTRDPFFLDSVDVLKGPSAAQFGRGSTGGVINQVTRRPLDITDSQVALSGYVPFGARATVDLNVREGNVAARLSAVGMDIDAARRDHVFQRRAGIAPSITWGVEGPTRVTLSFVHQQEWNMPDYGHPYLNGRPAPVAQRTFYGLKQTDYERTTTDVVTLFAEHRFNDNLAVRNTFRYGNYDRDLSATAPRFTAGTTLANFATTARINRQPQVRRGLDTLLVNSTEVALDGDTGPVSHNAVIGFEYGRETSQLQRFSQTGRPQALVLLPDWLQAGNLVTRTASNIETAASTWSLYAMDRINLSEHFELIGGLRYDHFAARQTNQLTNQRFGRIDAQASWRGAVVFKPVDGVRSYLAVGTSFNPSAESLTLAENNARLPPELSITFEAGGSWQVSPDLRLAGAVFRVEKQNARTPDPANDTLQVLDGIVRVDGFEVSANGRVLPALNIFAGITYLDSNITKTNVAAERGRHFANVAPLTGSLWATWDLPNDWQVGGGLQYVDARFANNSNTARVPHYMRYDAAIAWAPSEGRLKGIRFQLNALNLTNTRTYDTVYTGHTVPGIGRTIVFTTGAKF
jgi:catecholate siderophore receptor